MLTAILAAPAAIAATWVEDGLAESYLVELLDSDGVPLADALEVSRRVGRAQATTLGFLLNTTDTMAAGPPQIRVTPRVMTADGAMLVGPARTASVSAEQVLPRALTVIQDDNGNGAVHVSLAAGGIDCDVLAGAFLQVLVYGRGLPPATAGGPTVLPADLLACNASTHVVLAANTSALPGVLDGAVALAAAAVPAGQGSEHNTSPGLLLAGTVFAPVDQPPLRLAVAEAVPLNSTALVVRWRLTADSALARLTAIATALTLSPVRPSAAESSTEQVTVPLHALADRQAAVVGGLMSGTAYVVTLHFAAEGPVAANTSAAVTARTLPVAPAAVTDARVMNLTASSATLRWEHTASDANTTFRLVLAAAGGGPALLQASVATPEARLVALTHFTAYEVTVSV